MAEKRLVKKKEKKKEFVTQFLSLSFFAALTDTFILKLCFIVLAARSSLARKNL